MDPLQIAYVEKRNLSLGACIRAAMKEGRLRAEGRPFCYRVVRAGYAQRPVGVEIVLQGNE